jgi:hypothetical protein
MRDLKHQFRRCRDSRGEIATAIYLEVLHINAKISTQMHLIHDAGPVWYKDVIPPKTLYFNFGE